MNDEVVLSDDGATAIGTAQRGSVHGTHTPGPGAFTGGWTALRRCGLSRRAATWTTVSSSPTSHESRHTMVNGDPARSSRPSESQQHGRRAAHLANAAEAHALVEVPSDVVLLHAQAQRGQPLRTRGGDQCIRAGRTRPRAPSMPARHPWTSSAWRRPRSRSRDRPRATSSPGSSSKGSSETSSFSMAAPSTTC